MAKDAQSHTGSENAPGAPLGSLVANVGGRIQEMLDMAERVAEEVRAEAQAAGVTYLKDRQREADRIVQERMAELDAVTQSLAARAANMEREATAFVAEAEQVRWRLARLIGEEGLPLESTPSAHAASDAPSERQPEETGLSVPQAAALRATQLAVAGAERSEIEHMLRDQFGMDDPLAIDRVLRPGPA